MDNGTSAVTLFVDVTWTWHWYSPSSDSWRSCICSRNVILDSSYRTLYRLSGTMRDPRKERGVSGRRIHITCVWRKNKKAQEGEKWHPLIILHSSIYCKDPVVIFLTGPHFNPRTQNKNTQHAAASDQRRSLNWPHSLPPFFVPMEHCIVGFLCLVESWQTRLSLLRFCIRIN